MGDIVPILTRAGVLLVLLYCGLKIITYFNQDNVNLKLLFYLFLDK